MDGKPLLKNILGEKIYNQFAENNFTTVRFRSFDLLQLVRSQDFHEVILTPIIDESVRYYHQGISQPNDLIGYQIEIMDDIETIIHFREKILDEAKYNIISLSQDIPIEGIGKLYIVYYIGA